MAVAIGAVTCGGVFEVPPCLSGYGAAGSRSCVCDNSKIRGCCCQAHDGVSSASVRLEADGLQEGSTTWHHGCAPGSWVAPVEIPGREPGPPGGWGPPGDCMPAGPSSDHCLARRMCAGYSSVLVRRHAACSYQMTVTGAGWLHAAGRHAEGAGY